MLYGLLRRERFILCQYRPDNSGSFVSHGYRRNASRFAFQDISGPRINTFRPCHGHSNARRHTDNEEFSEISVALTRYLAQLLFTARGFVERCQANPCRKVTTTLELVCASYRCNNGRRIYGANARDCLQQFDTVVCLGCSGNSFICLTSAPVSQI